MTYYEILATWLSKVPILVPKARKLMYAKLADLQHRRRMEIFQAVFDELEREGIGSDQPWEERWKTIAKEQEDHIEAWQDAQLGIDPPVPQTPLEDMLQDHHRLRWAEWDLCDAIEKRWGAVSPFFDTRPGAVPRHCPH
jgi:hypothetical protein